jgi:hypothetical protein
MTQPAIAGVPDGNIQISSTQYPKSKYGKPKVGSGRRGVVAPEVSPQRSQRSHGKFWEAFLVRTFVFGCDLAPASKQPNP